MPLGKIYRKATLSSAGRDSQRAAKETELWLSPEQRRNDQ